MKSCLSAIELGGGVWNIRRLHGGGFYSDSTLMAGSTLIITRNRFGRGKIICSGLAQDIIKPNGNPENCCPSVCLFVSVSKIDASKIDAS